MIDVYFPKFIIKFRVDKSEPLNFKSHKLLELKLDEKEIYAQGIKVYTTIDSNIQKINYETISKYNPNDNSEISSIIMDVNSGDILSIYGGYDINEQYNRAIYSTRPIGSTIKPLLYYLALSCGMNPLTFYLVIKWILM